MAAPEELVAVPLTIYLGPVGTAFPDIDEAPGVAWKKLGTEGTANYDDSGVDVDLSETVNDFIPAGRTMPTKRFRTGEKCSIKLNLVDLLPVQWAKVTNDATVTDVVAGVGIAGYSKFSLYRGTDVNSYAVIGRGASAFDNDLTLQLVISKAFVSVNGTAKFNKGVPTMLPVEIEAIKHADTDLIEVWQQSAVAL